jgi:hypothetical protein
LNVAVDFDTRASGIATDTVNPDVPTRLAGELGRPDELEQASLA